MRTIKLLLATMLLMTGGGLAIVHVSQAQPARGALAAFERVKEVMNNRFRDMKLAGDPDVDFAQMVIAHHEDLIFLAKTQLEFGGDGQLRQLAQKILTEQERQIDDVKKWQVRRKEANYKAQPDQPLHGSGPLDKGRVSSPPPPRVVQDPSPAPAAKPTAANLPLVSGTVDKVEVETGRITIDHGPIPNLNMDGMTMVFRVQDASMLKGVKQGDRIQFSAERVQGQITVTRIQGRR